MISTETPIIQWLYNGHFTTNSQNTVQWLLLKQSIAFCKLIVYVYPPTEFCLLPKDEGSGMNFEFSLYFDQESQRCSPFMYKGEGGNANRFYSERECIRNCSNNPETLYPVNRKMILWLYSDIGLTQLFILLNH